MTMRARPTPVRAAAALAILAAVATLATGCGSPADEAQQASLAHLEAAVRILEANAGNTEAAGKALDDYLATNRDAILQAKARGIAALEALSPAKRDRFRARALERTRPIRERLDTLARTFPEPAPILQRLRHFQ